MPYCLHDGLCLLFDGGVSNFGALEGAREESNGSARLVKRGGEGKIRRVALHLKWDRFVDGVHRGFCDIRFDAVKSHLRVRRQRKRCRLDMTMKTLSIVGKTHLVH